MRRYLQGAVEVSEVPVRVCTIAPSVANASVHNCGPSTVYLGGPDVCSSGMLMGLPLESGEKISQLDSYEHDSTDLYAVTESGSATVAFLALSAR